MSSMKISVGVLLIALIALGAIQIAQTQDASARAVIETAAKALGGIDKVLAVRNITLHGYGQYAYQMGGGRISAAPDAPEKYMAANDLTRVYDLEHDRFEIRERRNMLFPFLAP